MPRFRPGQRVRALRTINQLVTEGSEWVVGDIIHQEGQFDIVVSDALQQATGFGGFFYHEDDFEPVEERYLMVWVAPNGDVIPCCPWHGQSVTSFLFDLFTR